MTEYWGVWVAIFGASAGAAALASYFALRFQVKHANKHILFLEREVYMSRVREGQNQRKLKEVMEALGSLQESTEIGINGLSQKIDELIAVLESRPEAFENELPRRYINLT